MRQTGTRSWSREMDLRFMCCPRVIIQGVLLTAVSHILTGIPIKHWSFFGIEHAS
jgi:hypothetical protein